MPLPKNKFDLQKNNILHKRSQAENIISMMISHQGSAQDRLDQIIKECEQINGLAEVPSFQFFQERIQLLMTSANGRRYSKHVLIIAAEVICVSLLPA